MLIVLDLNGTLCATSFDAHASSCTRPHDGRARAKYFWIRPHAHDFIASIIAAGHEIAVWTSCPQRNAEPLARGVLGPYFDRCKCLLAREQCTLIADDTNPYGSRKDLSVIASQRNMDVQSILLVDDSTDKVVQHENHIVISTYPVCTSTSQDDPSMHKREFDACLDAIQQHHHQQQLQ